MLRSPIIPRPEGAGRSPCTPILAEDDRRGAGMGFGLRIVSGGETLVHVSSKETCWVLLDGDATLALGSEEAAVSRRSLFDEAPSVALVPAGVMLRVQASRRAEWAVIEATNARVFDPLLVVPAAVAVERRGAGLMQEAATRLVRLAFDQTQRAESSFVVGEVVNFPGRWSSYPPHHHAQPELYHYRFTDPRGYGHAELGNRVYKVRSHDTLVITGARDHAQVSAPGYGMYYLWVVRHLPGQPYVGFDVTADHAWMLEPGNRGWEPPR